jgi:tetratricopeptide (TPR) repeat protein
VRVVTASSEQPTVALDAVTPVDGSSQPAPTNLDPEGDRAAESSMLGRYAVLGEIGRGGMGRVVRAYDPRLRREVAIKLLASHDEVGVARMVREARSLARLSHPNVVAVHDVEEHDGQCFIVMELVPGPTLRDFMSEGTKPWRDIVARFAAAGAGLAAAHGAGLVHRDFKPANVILGEDGRVRVTDFGLAREQGSSTATSVPTDSGSADDREILDDLTRPGTVMGTPAYMAPEQHMGEEADAKADQYAFCVALHEALVGQRPFTGDTATLCRAKLAGPPELPSTVPRHLAAVVRRGLSPSASDRYPDMDVLLRALQIDPAHRRNRLLAVGFVGLAAAGFVGGTQLHDRRARAACEAEAASIDEVYGQARASEIRGALEAALPKVAADTLARVEPMLDDWAREWADASRQTCLAKIDAPLSSSDAALACLAERRDAFEAAIETLATADATVARNAVRAASALPAPADCLDADRLGILARWPDDEASRARVREIRANLARATSLHEAGSYPEAIARATEAIEQATTVAWGPLVAEAQQTRGNVFLRDSQYAKAEADFRAAFEEAVRTGHDRIAAEAAGALVFALYTDAARADEALAWGTVSKAILDRIGEVESLTAMLLHQHTGQILINLGDLDRAEPEIRESVRIAEARLGPDHPATARARVGFAILKTHQRDFDGAHATYQRVVASLERSLGPDHPDLALALINHSYAMLHAHRLEESQALAQRAVEIARAALGPDHRDVARAYLNLGAAAAMAQRNLEARAALRSAVEILEALGDAPRDLAGALANLAIVHGHLEEHEDAVVANLRAYEVRRATLGEDHHETLSSRLNLAIAQLRVGMDEEGGTTLRSALAAAERTLPTDDYLRARLAAKHGEWLLDRDPPDFVGARARLGPAVEVLRAKALGEEAVIGNAELAYARALANDAERARPYIEAARARFAALDRTEEVAEADAWLAAHPAP